MKPLITILLAVLIFVLSGCMIIWSDQVFVATFMKTVDANDLDIIAEPNYVQIGSGQTKTKNDKIKATTIYGIIESE
jgi:hypothetical protein